MNRTNKPRHEHGPEVAEEVARKYWMGKKLGSMTLCADYGISINTLLKWARQYCKAHPEVSKTRVIAK